jgi:hypothetical protein
VKRKVKVLARWEWSETERVGANLNGLGIKWCVAPVRIWGAQKGIVCRCKGGGKGRILLL